MLNQMKPARRIRESVLEYANTADARIDRAAGIIRGVKVLGVTSTNRREYTRAALLEAAGHYEGIRVNLNHPSREAIKANRGIHEWVGTLENVTVKDSGVFADLHLLREHPYTRAILEAAERHPGKFGLSHNADCTGTIVNGRQIIDSVENVRSVDIVQRPATTVSLFEMDGDADFPSGGSPPSATGDDLQTSIMTVVNDSVMGLDEKLAAIRAILKAAGTNGPPDKGSVETWRKPPRPVTESALPFTNAKEFAAMVGAPASRSTVRTESRSVSLLEHMAADAALASALPYKNAKEFAAMVR